MMELMIQACSLTVALAMTTHRCRRTPAPILHPGPITTLGPMLQREGGIERSGRVKERGIAQGQLNEQSGRVNLGSLKVKRGKNEVSKGR